MLYSICINLQLCECVCVRVCISVYAEELRKCVHSTGKQDLQQKRLQFIELEEMAQCKPTAIPQLPREYLQQSDAVHVQPDLKETPILVKHLLNVP